MSVRFIQSLIIKAVSQNYLRLNIIYIPWRIRIPYDDRLSEIILIFVLTVK